MDPNAVVKDGEAHQTPSLEVTRRDSRALITTLLIFLLHRIRYFLIDRPDPTPPGSQPIKFKPKVLGKTQHCARKIGALHVLDLSPSENKHREKPVKPTRRLYYFPGGGWHSGPSDEHMKLCCQLCESLPDILVTVVSIPLAPSNPAPLAFPQMLEFYAQVMNESAEAGQSVIFGGDSSGGNVVLALTLEALRTGAAKASPVALMVLAPSVDLTRSNPEIQRIEHLDPLLKYKFIKKTAAEWIADWDATDPRVSPLYADISLLAKADVQIIGLTGTYDMLTPDAHKFRQKCIEAGVKGKWLEWEKQIHVFPLLFSYGIPEAKAGLSWLLQAVKDIA